MLKIFFGNILYNTLKELTSYWGTFFVLLFLSFVFAFVFSPLWYLVTISLGPIYGLIAVLMHKYEEFQNNLSNELWRWWMYRSPKYDCPDWDKR